LLPLALLTACGVHSHSNGQSPSPAPQPPGWDGDLRLPDAVDTNPDPNIVEVSLEAQVQTISMGQGPQIPMWTYNGTVPGPVIRAKKGDRLIVHFRNSLPESTTIHWHGVRVPNAMDGSSMTQKPIAPGETFDYAFVLPDAGTFWYHPHLDSSTQVGYGLYGALVVEDPGEPPLGDELIVIFSDASIDTDGGLEPGDAAGWYGDYFGREGTVLLVNGRVLPTLRMRAGVPQRWRVINASRARFFQALVPGVSLQRVGTDVGLSSAPQAVDRVSVVPGEREELVAVATEPGTSSTAMFRDANRFHLPASVVPADQPLLNVEVTQDPPSTAPRVPATLASIVPLDTADAGTRTVTFDVVDEGGVSYLGIDGRTNDEIDVHADSTEVWEISNTTTQDHPFHMHGFPFQVLDVNGTPPPVLEWRDTVNVPANGTMRFAVHFDDREGMWMFHCHILDHADMGMMAMLVVQPPDPGGAQPVGAEP
jgi:FtsP/CotA-like multicopper oxidase with cupredoxin domain